MNQSQYFTVYLRHYEVIPYQSDNVDGIEERKYRFFHPKDLKKEQTFDNLHHTFAFTVEIKGHQVEIIDQTIRQ